MLPLPPATQALLLINVGVYFLSELTGNWLLNYGALWPLGNHFLPWQILSYGFLHGSLAHLGFNMLTLWLFAPELERVWGPKRFVQFFLVSVGVAGVVQLIVSMLLGSGAPTVGASGGLFGLLLGYALVFPNRQFDAIGFLPVLLLMIPSPVANMLGIVLFFVLFTNRQALPFLRPIPIPALTYVALFGAMQLIFGIFSTRSGIAYFAHLGGMLGGWLMLRYWRGQPPFGAGRRR
jgi:membrane associated rhomboid family serine protease